MGPGVRTNRMPCRCNLLEDLRMPHRVLTDREEHSFGALLCKRLKYGWRIARPRPVIEGEHYFPITQEIVGLEVLQPEARCSSGIDFNDSRDPERIGIAGT